MEPRTRKPRAAARLAAAVVGVMAVGLAAGAWWWMNPPDPIQELRARHRALVTLERVPAPELGARFERWRMIAAGADTVTGLWRGATAAGDSARAGEPEWAVVLLGGIGTDDRAAMLVPDSLDVGVLAVSWPWKGARHMSPPAFVASLPAIHDALLRTPGAIARAVEAVRASHPRARVALIGASLGVAPTVAAMPLAPADALALVDGAADLRRLLRSEIVRALGGGPGAAAVAPAGAALGARLIQALEPARYGAAVGTTPVLLVDAERDERYPRECVAELHATFPHAVRATHPGAHMRPEDRRQVGEIVGTVWAWLDTVRVGRGAGARTSPSR